MPRGLDRFARLATLLAAALAAGCSERAPAPEASAAAGAPAAAAAASAQDPARDMVAAVPLGPGAAALELRFSMAERPEVGQPFELEVLVRPLAPLDRIQVTFQGGEGLEVRSGREMPAIARPQVGDGVTHRLAVVPQADGIFSLTAVARLQRPAGEPEERTFAIPVIAGKGLLGSGSAAP